MGNQFTVAAATCDAANCRRRMSPRGCTIRAEEGGRLQGPPGGRCRAEGCKGGRLQGGGLQGGGLPAGDCRGGGSSIRALASLGCTRQPSQTVSMAATVSRPRSIERARPM